MAGVTLALAACSGQKGQGAAGENPFLSEYDTPFGVPPFDKIKPEHYKPALLQGMEEQKKEIEAIVNQRSMPDFENTIAALDRSGALLNKVAYVFYAQSAACADDEMLALGTDIAPLMAQHSDDINLNPRLFERVKQVYERKADFNLNHEQERLLELLAQAENMEDLLAIESKLSDVRYELENYGSQLRLLDNQIDYSTVNVDVDEVERVTDTGEKSFFGEIKDRFGNSLYTVGRDIRGFVIVVLGSLPLLIVWAVIIVIAVLIVKKIRKGRKKKKEEKKAEKTE